MTYDIIIHCNVMSCRKDIYSEEKACVTTCSHIFCLDCANIKFSEALVCPACECPLTQRNDIVLTQLSPSEEYKSSVLAGLTPAVIMDICNRALSFYNYQVSQELYYREALQQSLQMHSDKQQNRLQVESRETSRLLKVEKNKNQALVQENELEKRRNYDLKTEIQNKTRQFTKLQQMYEKLKHKSMGTKIHQSVQGNITHFIPTPNSTSTNTNNVTQFQTPAYAKPQQPMPPYEMHQRQSSEYHNRQHQRYTNLPVNLPDSTRHEIERHRQQRNVSASTIGIRPTKPPPIFYHSYRRPSISVIGVESKQETAPYHHGRTPQQQGSSPR